MTFAGVIPILPTPFHDDETLDLDSWRRLLEFMIGLGVDGVTILGVLGESNRLNDHEREQLIETAVETVRQRIPIIVGTSHSGTHAATYLSRRAQDLGANAVMVTPAKEAVPNDDRILELYRRIGEEISIPIVLQDHPASSRRPSVRRSDPARAAPRAVGRLRQGRSDPNGGKNPATARGLGRSTHPDTYGAWRPLCAFRTGSGLRRLQHRLRISGDPAGNGRRCPRWRLAAGSRHLFSICRAHRFRAAARSGHSQGAIPASRPAQIRASETSWRHRFAGTVQTARRASQPGRLPTRTLLAR